MKKINPSFVVVIVIVLIIAGIFVVCQPDSHHKDVVKMDAYIEMKSTMLDSLLLHTDIDYHATENKDYLNLQDTYTKYTSAKTYDVKKAYYDVYCRDYGKVFRELLDCVKAEAIAEYKDSTLSIHPFGAFQ